MDPNALAGMVFTLLLAALVGGFIVLSPITKRLGMLLEQKLQEKAGPNKAVAGDEVKQLRELCQLLESEVRSLSERQQFMEQLIAKREAAALPGASAEHPPA